MNESANHCPVAIVGMSCFFPRSPGLKAYWRLLFQGLDAITEVPETHWSKHEYFDPDPRTPDRVYCARGGFIPPVDFDPSEFGIPPASLEATDSSQLLALAAAKHALRDAELAYDPARTSVVLGVTGTQELVIPLSSRLGFPKWRRALQEAGIEAERCEQIIGRIADSYIPWQENSFPGLLGNVVAGRISNRLNLGGTNCVVDAACASSLAAVHLALLELASGRSDMVITGGVDTLNDIFMHMCFAKTQILSPTGDVRPFSSEADGTVLGEGIGLTVLKRLSDAERDGNRIYAVIRGIGSASDGRSQSIYAPRKEGQLKALKAAYDAAGIDPATVGLIEAHGTGTRVGDKVEVGALCDIMHASSANGGRCALGSVKSMIGHTKAAAGAAGLIKAALALYHKVLLPTLKADEPDPALGLDASPFYLNTRTRPWLVAAGQPRRAGVSAFGFGGSNFHLVLEEHRAEKPCISWDGSVQILGFSAAGRTELIESIDAFCRQLDDAGSEEAWAWAAAQCRSGFDARRPFRLLTVAEQPAGAASDLRRAAEALQQREAAHEFELSGTFFGASPNPGQLGFLFPGQGSQYPGMGRTLVGLFPEAMAAVQQAQDLVDVGPPLADLIYPPHGRRTESDEQALRATDKAQPAIGAISLAMLRVLETFGLAPDAVAGHSFGELAALCAAGWITPKDLFSLAAARGRAMAEAGAGSMLAVRAPLAELEALVGRLGLPVVLANRNAPDQGVLSGEAAAVAEAGDACRRCGYAVVELPVAGAFHSPSMRRAHDRFLHALSTVRLTPRSTLVFSGNSAQPYPQHPEEAARMLAEQMLRPVDFVGQIEAMYRAGIRTFVEIGPRSVLTKLVGAILQNRSFQAFSVDASNGRNSGLADLATTLCRLAALGHPVRIEKWENPSPAPETARMRIALTGANFRSHRPPRRRHPQTAAAGIVRRRSAGEAAPINPPSAPEPPEPPRQLPSAAADHMEPDTNANRTPAADALRSIQEGLKTIQAIQLQTAQAHRKFLETQSEATRVLMELVRNTARLADLPAELLQPPPPPAPDRAALIATPTPAAPDLPRAPEPGPPVATGPSLAAEAPAAAGSVSEAGASAAPGGRLEKTLLTIVSHLTGYPAKMLGLEMDIEADLGIDSIKRVEILSALEEKMPGLPSVAPEDLPRLKTLGRIIDHLSGRRTQDQPPAVIPLPAAPLTPSIAVGRQRIAQVLLEVTSSLTGYPAEMLGLEMDIEADLGIDSIKRVEILSALEEKMPGLPSVAPEDLPRLKTLERIIDHFGGSPAKAEPSVSEPALVAAAAAEPPPTAEEIRAQPSAPQPTAASEAGLAPRRVVVMKPAPATEPEAIAVPGGRKVVLTDDGAGLSQALKTEFERLGIQTVMVSNDLALPEQDLFPAAGLLILQNPGSDTIEADLKRVFELTRALAKGLLESASQGSAFFATVTRLDGACGFSGQPTLNPIQGALAGLTKTAAIEWPEVICHALDVAPAWTDARACARAVIREVTCRGPVEIGLSDGSRLTPDLVPQAYPAGAVNLHADEAVVISGGARGITAVCALELARRVRPALIIFGRTPVPAPEPEWMAALESGSEIKKALLQTEFAGIAARPADVERRLKQLLAGREVARTLGAIRAAGAPVAYYSVDVRDAGQVQSALADARGRFGPIRALIHGAGVLEDRLIVDKSTQQFERVLDTKLKGFHSLLAALAEDEVKVLVLFSSVTARFGNKGQADYAMANEALNKLAWAEARRRPDCRIVSINWGPWECGMVTPSIQREFERRGVALLPAAEGARSLLRELGRPAGAPAEVVIGGILKPFEEDPAAPTARPSLSVLFEREIELRNHPILESHVIDGTPVVPMALLAEWLGHGALHENPGLMLQGLEDLRVMNGIRLQSDCKRIRVLGGKPRPRNGFYEIDLELRNSPAEGRDILHCRARAILAERFSRPPVYRLSASLACNHYPRSAAEIYEKILFHGRHLQGLRRVQCCTADGMVAEVAGAPDPRQWFSAPLRNSWLCDPLVLDSAFQMASLWCYEQLGCVSLPSHAASYRQYRAAFPPEGVTIVLEVRAATARKMRGDFSFLDPNGEVVASMTGCEAVLDPLLNRAFKPV